MKSVLFLIFTFIVFLISSEIYLSYFLESDINQNETFSYQLTHNPKLDRTIEELEEEKLVLISCPSSLCVEMLLESIRSAKHSITCAFFDIDIQSILFALTRQYKNGVDVRLIVDEDQSEWSEKEYPFLNNVDRPGYMHNKFCVFDETVVMTGTWNPTHRGTFHNNNTVLYLNSSAIAHVYHTEWEELKEGWGFGNSLQQTDFILDGLTSTNVSVFFCPEDWCSSRILQELRKAKESIIFQTFSFTHPWIADVLIEKRNEGVKVSGICEKSQNNRYHQFERLLTAGIDVRWDTNPANMHNKLFVIDNTTLIVGSMNPSKNGDLRNDENIVIVNYL